MREPEKHVGALDRVLELVVLLNDDMTQSLARDGLTVSRTRVLWELRHRGPVPQRVLADALGVRARTVTGLVDGLVATGFVTRQPHPTDRRAALVTFTPRGTRTVKAMERGRRELADMLFAGMADRRFDCFVNGLDEVLARLHEHGLSPAIRENGR
jgi:DNA-binding MarR family transcriptional regulator